jgi:four helix bundle protein
VGRFALELQERVEKAADRTVPMALALPNNVAGWVIGRQIIRSSCSVGANLEESMAVLTRKDYTNKVSISLRETRETLYWMRRIESNRLLPAKRLMPLKAEWDELVAILTAAQKKLRGRR